MTRRVESLFGAGDIEALCTEAAPMTIVPWPTLVRPLRTAHDRTLVADLLAQPPRADRFADLDPRGLHASQPWVTRVGVAYYLHEDTYRRSGCTWADQFDVGNKYPVVHRRGEALVILSGHHRAAAALLAGEQIRVRLADWAAAGSAAMVVTPSLIVGGEEPALSHYACRDRWAAEVTVNMRDTAWLTRHNEHDVRHLLRELAVEEAWLRHQLHYANTGQIRLPRPQEGATKHH